MAQSQEAEYWKEKGNAEFKQGNYVEAGDFYTKAIQLDPKHPVYLSNRAMAYLKLKRFGSALTDCRQSLLLDPSYTKAKYRRSLALEGFGDLSCAIKDLQELIKVEPKNKEFVAKLEKLKSVHTESSCLHSNDSGLFHYQTASEKPKDLTRILVKTTKKSSVSSAQQSTSKEMVTSQIQKATVLQTNANNTVTTPMRIPTTSYQLATDWKRYRTDVNLLADYFAGIEPTEFQRVFGNSLESKMMTDIINCLPMILSRHPAKFEAILHQLPNVKRFSTVLSFISLEEREGEKF